MKNKNAGGGGVIIGIIVIVAAIVGLFISHDKAPNLFKILLWVAIIVVALIIAAIVLIVVLARRSSKKDAENKKTSNTSINKGNLSDEQAQIINKGRSDLVAVRMISSRIKDTNVRTAMMGINSTAEKILNTLREKPEEIQSARQFTNYYLPTLKDVLEKFQRLEASQVDPEDFASKLTVFLADVQKALDKQYSKLFAGDKFDMSVDMKAMTIAIKRDGLLEEDEILHA